MNEQQSPIEELMKIRKEKLRKVFASFLFEGTVHGNSTHSIVGAQKLKDEKKLQRNFTAVRNEKIRLSSPYDRWYTDEEVDTLVAAYREVFVELSKDDDEEVGQISLFARESVQELLDLCEDYLLSQIDQAEDAIVNRSSSEDKAQYKEYLALEKEISQQVILPPLMTKIVRDAFQGQRNSLYDTSTIGAFIKSLERMRNQLDEIHVFKQILEGIPVQE